MPLSLRDLHRDHQPLVCPLAHDALSARLIERAGFKTFNVGGSALLAARFALPDLGIAALGEMVAGLRDIVEATTLPCLVDADDGYGDVKGVTRTIQSYEAIGIAGCLLEDQAREGKLPGATTARAVIAVDVMEQKLRAAQAARRNKDFVIIGRTDALGLEGIDGAIRRAERFLKAGADGIFVAGLKTIEQYERVGGALKGAWNCAAIFEGGQTPWLMPRELHAMGFSQIAYPNILMGRIAKALETGLDRLRRFGDGDAAAFKNAAGELALDALADAVHLKQWNEIETKFTQKP